MYKIAVMGKQESILCFAPLGIETVAVESVSQAELELKRLVKSDYGIIYISEDVMSDLGQQIEKYQKYKNVAIIPIPGFSGSLGIGMKNIKKSVEKAVGTDILSTHCSRESFSFASKFISQ